MSSVLVTRNAWNKMSNILSIIVDSKIFKNRYDEVQVLGNGPSLKLLDIGKYGSCVATHRKLP